MSDPSSSGSMSISVLIDTYTFHEMRWPSRPVEANRRRKNSWRLMDKRAGSSSVNIMLVADCGPLHKFTFHFGHCLSVQPSFTVLFCSSTNIGPFDIIWWTHLTCPALVRFHVLFFSPVAVVGGINKWIAIGLRITTSITTQVQWDIHWE